MSEQTDNHDYETPPPGTENWHEPLNANFEALDVDVEVRDVAVNREDYEPDEGAKFLELDTGIVYIGDGDEWLPAMAMAYYDEDGELDCGELVECLEPESDENGGTEASPSTFGVNARSVHEGAIVFGDSTRRGIWSESSDEIRSQMPFYAPEFNTTSARMAKTAIEPVDPQGVLKSVESLPVHTWEFKGHDGGRHMGPMAADFADRFDLGEGEDSIATVDADGVALAAIQGLAARLQEENERLSNTLVTALNRLDELEAELEALSDD